MVGVVRLAASSDPDDDPIVLLLSPPACAPLTPVENKRHDEREKAGGGGGYPRPRACVTPKQKPTNQPSQARQAQARSPARRPTTTARLHSTRFTRCGPPPHRAAPLSRCADTRPARSPARTHQRDACAPCRSRATAAGSRVAAVVVFFFSFWAKVIDADGVDLDGLHVVVGGDQEMRCCLGHVS